MKFLSLRFCLPIILIAGLVSGLFSARDVQASVAGWALQFDGIDDYVELGATESIFGANWKTSKSFSMWVKPLGAARVCDNGDVAYCDQLFVNRPHFFGIARGVIDGQDRIWFWNFSTSGVQKIGILYSPEVWTHLAFVHYAGVLKVYQNGSLVSQVASGETDVSAEVLTTRLLLGAFFREEKNKPYHGLIDEVRIYDTELSQQTIVETLRTPLNGDEPGLRAYYMMSNGEGLTLSDDSVNSFHGVLRDGINSPDDVPYPQWVESDVWEGPMAHDRTVILNEDTATPIQLIGSGGDDLVFHLDSSPVHGVLSGTIPDVIYTPDPNYFGMDEFTFHVSDGVLSSDVATIFIEVLPVNDPPVAVDDSYNAISDNLLNISAPGVLANDSDIENDPLTAVLVGNVQHGVLNLSPSGSFTYTPDAGYHGQDVFTYWAQDLTATSNIATVRINIARARHVLFLPLITK